MYDDSVQGESDDYKKPKSLLDMKCDKLGRHRAMPGLGYAYAKID
ncbi:MULTISPECIES: hypothetical protein [unclassified Nostoc]|nr:hypothetical protein [Nostoc sp. JL31]